MAYLRDSDHSSRLLALDTSGVHRLPAIRSWLLRRAAGPRVSGHFGYIAGKPAALYSAGGKLWVAIEKHPWFLDEVKAEIDEADNGCRVAISAPDRQLKFFVDVPESDLGSTPFASPEDFSFGLWVARIIKNPERQNVLLETLADAKLDEVPEHAETEDASGSVDVRRRWGQSGRDSADPHRRQSPG